MAIITTTYSKGYIGKEFIERPGLQKGSYDFEMCDEDFNFRILMQTKFSPKPDPKYDSTGEGFDGDIWYYFRFEGQPKGKEKEYTTMLTVKKLGDESVISIEPSDLEKFAVMHGYEKKRLE